MYLFLFFFFLVKVKDSFRLGYFQFSKHTQATTPLEVESSEKIKHSPALKGLYEYLLTATGLIYTLLINPISWVISFPFYC